MPEPKRVPCIKCGKQVEITGRYASRAKSTICETCDPYSPANNYGLPVTEPQTKAPNKIKRNALLVVAAVIGVQVVYATAIEPFVRNAQYFNDCVELQAELIREKDRSFDRWDKVKAIHFCNGGRNLAR